MNLKPYEIRLISYLLDIAGDEFSSHGCSDLDLNLEALALTDREKRELCLQVAIEGGDPDEIAELAEGPEAPRYANDWCVMEYFSKMFDGKAMPEVAPETESELVGRLNRHVASLMAELERLQARMAASKAMVLEVANRL